MKVLLTHSYFMRFDPKQWGLQQSYPPLMTLYAASVLRDEGHELVFFDTMFLHAADEIRPVIEKEKPDVLIICDDGFNYLTKMCLTNMREAAWAMAGIGKTNQCTVVAASSDATDHFEDYLDRGVDFVVHGEPEMCLKDLIGFLAAGQDGFQEVRGISYREGNITKTTAAREALKDLDELPFPAWDLVDLGAYRKMWMNRYGHFTINLTTSRGCPFHCTWCAKPLYGYRYNLHTPAYIVKQLLHLKSICDYSSVWFCDDIFGLNREWVHAFADAVNDSGLKIRYIIQSRADLLIKQDYLHDLSRSGCDTVWLGAESGSQKILDAMQKGVQVEEIYEASRMMKKAGIKPAFFIQFGYPGETMEDIRMTIRMINRLLPDDIGISVSYPLPGTVFYEMVKDELKEKANWTDSDDLALMFRNTYPPAFYKHLHRYVHKQYRLHQGFDFLLHFFRNPFSLNKKMLRRILLMLYYLPAGIWAKIQLKKSVDG